MREYFDSRIQRNIFYINAGEYYISTKKEIISTLLGSCISACLYDPISGIGGMNHFMLPEKAKNTDLTLLKQSDIKSSYDTLRYGLTAMEILIAEMQKKGVKRENLTAKVFGGGMIINQSKSKQGVGWSNIQFIRSYLLKERIPILAENTGESIGRKVLFDTADNSVTIKHIEIETVAETEKQYLERISKPQPKPKVIYF